MVFKMAHPIKRNGIFWLRKKVPDDLRPLLGKTEVKKSLKTRDPAEAKIRFARAIAEIEESWSRLRAGLVTLTNREAYALAGEICRDVIYERENDPLLPHWERYALNEGMVAIGEFKHSRVNSGGATVHLTPKQTRDRVYGDRASRDNAARIDSFLLKRGLRLDDKSRKLLDEAVVRAMVVARKTLLRRMNNDFSPHPELSRFPALENPTLMPVKTSSDKQQLSHPSGEGKMLSTYIDVWVNQKLSSKAWKNPTDARQHRVWAERFIELVGDRNPASYRKADASIFCEALRVIPPLYTNNTAFKGLTFPQAVEKATSIREVAKAAKESPPRTISIGNLNKILGYLAAFWNWLDARVDDLPRDPFSPLKLGDIAQRKKRTPFRPHELQTIFSAPLYTGCKSQASWLTPGVHIPRDQGIFWVPIIALFTGARSGEILQLLVADVKERSGVRYFDMVLDDDDEDDEELSPLDQRNDDLAPMPGKEFKTSASIRRIPIHNELVRLGFLEFWQNRRKEGERLFPEMGASAWDGKLSSNYSSKFRRFLEKLEIKRKRNAFHSFRHNFEDACKKSRVDRHAMFALQGHKETGMAGIYGDGDYGLKLLNEELQKINYEGLDLSHLVHCAESIVTPNT